MKRDELENKLKVLEKDLTNSKIFNSPEKIIPIQKEYQKLKNILEVFKKLESVESEIKEIEKILAEKDEELKEIAEKELIKLKKNKEKLTKEIQELESGKQEERNNIIMEIRAGTGGEEAALFASSLFRMYSMYAEKNSWPHEVLYSNRTGIGGLKEIALRISGKNVWQNLKNEGGIHRVQRIPETEKSGRIHTSTASVAVLPEANETEINIRPEDLKIETYRASGHGGQNVQKIESAVRITHLPTGLVVSCQEERSQSKNKEKVLKILRSRILAQEEERKQKEADQTRRSQIKKAERADKIRTYNFPQSRVTDHRINKSWHNIDNIMNGDLDDIVKDLFSLRETANP